MDDVRNTPCNNSYTKENISPVLKDALMLCVVVIQRIFMGPFNRTSIYERLKK